MNILKILITSCFIFAIASCANEEFAATDKYPLEVKPTDTLMSPHITATTEVSHPTPLVVNTIGLEGIAHTPIVETSHEEASIDPTAIATRILEDGHVNLSSISIDESILLIAKKENQKWQLSTFPYISIMDRPEFTAFYGDVAQAENLWLYFLNFFPQQSFDRNWLSVPGIGGYDAPSGGIGTGLWLVDIQGNKLSQVLPKAKAISWNPTQNQFVYVSEKGLFLWNSEGDSLEQELILVDNLDPVFIKWSPDGEKIAGMVTEPNGVESYWIFSLEQQDFEQLISLPISLIERVSSDLAWSPNSQFLLIRNQNKVVDIVSGQVVDIEPEGVAEWLPNSTLIKLSDHGAIIVDPWDVVITRIEISSMLAPSVSPNGKEVAYGIMDETGTISIFLVSLENLSTKTVGNIADNKIKSLRTIQWGLNGKELYIDDFRAETPIWYCDVESDSGISAITKQGLLISVFSK